MDASGPFAAHGPSPPQMLLENQGLLGNAGQNKVGKGTGQKATWFPPLPSGRQHEKAFSSSPTQIPTVGRVQPATLEPRSP